MSFCIVEHETSKYLDAHDAESAAYEATHEAICRLKPSDFDFKWVGFGFECSKTGAWIETDDQSTDNADLVEQGAQYLIDNI